MKMGVIILVGLFSLSTGVEARVSKEDIRKLVEHRISDRLILAFIRVNGPVGELSSMDLISLKKLGASDAVVMALLEASDSRSQSKPRPRPAKKADLDMVCVDRVPVLYQERDFSRHSRMRIRGNRFRSRSCR